MKKIILFVLLTAVSYPVMIAYNLAPACEFADKEDKEGWNKIGETIVDFASEKDEIIAIGMDRYAFMKIKVDGAPIYLDSVYIYFDNGDEQSVTIDKEIEAPGETSAVQINGGERSLNKVSFVYKAINNKIKKAHLELWGYKTNSGKSQK